MAYTNKKKIRENSSDHACLYNADVAFEQSDHAHLYTLSIRPLDHKFQHHLTISSTAFPNVAFNRAPTVCPIYSDSCSVAELNNVARGMTAKRFNAKTLVALDPNKVARNPMGRKTRSG